MASMLMEIFNLKIRQIKKNSIIRLKINIIMSQKEKKQKLIYKLIR